LLDPKSLNKELFRLKVERDTALGRAMTLETALELLEVSHKQMVKQLADEGRARVIAEKKLEAAVLAENEWCAKIADRYGRCGKHATIGVQYAASRVREVADAIRARHKKPESANG